MLGTLNFSPESKGCFINVFPCWQYSTLLSVIFAMELTAGILVAVMEADVSIASRDLIASREWRPILSYFFFVVLQIKKYLQNEMIEQVENKYVNETEGGLSRSWNHMQKEVNADILMNKIQLLIM